MLVAEKRPSLRLLTPSQFPPRSDEEQIEKVLSIFEDSARAHRAMVEAGAETVVAMARIVTDCFRKGGKVLFFGNGGSAADAQHAAAELMGRFNRDRDPLPALSLATDTSVLTCVGNDYEYDEIFARQVRGLARPGDVVIGLSTSGNSENVARALAAARHVGACALALTGERGRAVGNASDVCLTVPSSSTPRIQELHILALHTLCDLVEADLFG